MQYTSYSGMLAEKKAAVKGQGETGGRSSEQGKLEPAWAATPSPLDHLRAGSQAEHKGQDTQHQHDSRSALAKLSEQLRAQKLQGLLQRPATKPSSTQTHCTRPTTQAHYVMQPRPAAVPGLQLSTVLNRHPQLFDRSKVSAVERFITHIDQLPDRYLEAEVVYLSKNSLSQLTGIHQFTRVRVLSLADNLLADLEQVLDDLCGLQSLEVLNLTGNPCTNTAFYRSRTLARLPALIQLDGKSVGYAERETAQGLVHQEQAYLAVMMSNACMVHKLAMVYRKQCVHRELFSALYTGRTWLLTRGAAPDHVPVNPQRLLELWDYEGSLSPQERGTMRGALRREIARRRQPSAGPTTSMSAASAAAQLTWKDAFSQVALCQQQAISRLLELVGQARQQLTAEVQACLPAPLIQAALQEAEDRRLQHQQDREMVVHGLRQAVQRLSPGPTKLAAVRDAGHTRTAVHARSSKPLQSQATRVLFGSTAGSPTAHSYSPARKLQIESRAQHTQQQPAARPSSRSHSLRPSQSAKHIREMEGVQRSGAAQGSRAGSAQQVTCSAWDGHGQQEPREEPAPAWIVQPGGKQAGARQVQRRSKSAECAGLLRPEGEAGRAGTEASIKLNLRKAARQTAAKMQAPPGTSSPHTKEKQGPVKPDLGRWRIPGHSPSRSMSPPPMPWAVQRDQDQSAGHQGRSSTAQRTAGAALSQAADPAQRHVSPAPSYRAVAGQSLSQQHQQAGGSGLGVRAVDQAQLGEEWGDEDGYEALSQSTLKLRQLSQRMMQLQATLTMQQQLSPRPPRHLPVSDAPAPAIAARPRGSTLDQGYQHPWLDTLGVEPSFRPTTVPVPSQLPVQSALNTADLNLQPSPEPVPQALPPEGMQPSVMARAPGARIPAPNQPWCIVRTSRSSISDLESPMPKGQLPEPTEGEPYPGGAGMQPSDAQHNLEPAPAMYGVQRQDDTQLGLNSTPLTTVYCPPGSWGRKAGRMEEQEAAEAAWADRRSDEASGLSHSVLTSRMEVHMPEDVTRTWLPAATSQLHYTMELGGSPCKSRQRTLDHHHTLDQHRSPASIYSPAKRAVLRTRDAPEQLHVHVHLAGQKLDGFQETGGNAESGEDSSPRNRRNGQDSACSSPRVQAGRREQARVKGGSLGGMGSAAGLRKPNTSDHVLQQFTLGDQLGGGVPSAKADALLTGTFIAMQPTSNGSNSSRQHRPAVGVVATSQDNRCDAHADVYHGGADQNRTVADAHQTPTAAPTANYRYPHMDRSFLGNGHHQASILQGGSTGFGFGAQGWSSRPGGMAAAGSVGPVSRYHASPAMQYLRRSVDSGLHKVKAGLGVPGGDVAARLSRPATAQAMSTQQDGSPRDVLALPAPTVTGLAVKELEAELVCGALERSALQQALVAEQGEGALLRQQLVHELDTGIALEVALEDTAQQLQDTRQALVVQTEVVEELHTVCEGLKVQETQLQEGQQHLQDQLQQALQELNMTKAALEAAQRRFIDETGSLQQKLEVVVEEHSLVVARAALHSRRAEAAEMIAWRSLAQRSLSAWRRGAALSFKSRVQESAAERQASWWAKHRVMRRWQRAARCHKAALTLQRITTSGLLLTAWHAWRMHVCGCQLEAHSTRAAVRHHTMKQLHCVFSSWQYVAHVAAALLMAVDAPGPAAVQLAQQHLEQQRLRRAWEGLRLHCSAHTSQVMSGSQARRIHTRRQLLSAWQSWCHHQHHQQFKHKAWCRAGRRYNRALVARAWSAWLDSQQQVHRLRQLEAIASVQRSHTVMVAWAAAARHSASIRKKVARLTAKRITSLQAEVLCRWRSFSRAAKHMSLCDNLAVQHWAASMMQRCMWAWAALTQTSSMARKQEQGIKELQRVLQVAVRWRRLSEAAHKHNAIAQRAQRMIQHRVVLGTQRAVFQEWARMSWQTSLVRRATAASFCEAALVCQSHTVLLTAFTCWRRVLLTAVNRKLEAARQQAAHEASKVSSLQHDILALQHDHQHNMTDADTRAAVLQDQLRHAEAAGVQAAEERDRLSQMLSECKAHVAEWEAQAAAARAECASKQAALDQTRDCVRDLQLRVAQQAAQHTQETETLKERVACRDRELSVAASAAQRADRDVAAQATELQHLRSLTASLTCELAEREHRLEELMRRVEPGFSDDAMHEAHEAQVWSAGVDVVGHATGLPSHGRAFSRGSSPVPADRAGGMLHQQGGRPYGVVGGVSILAGLAPEAVGGTRGHANGAHAHQLDDGQSITSFLAAALAPVGSG